MKKKKQIKILENKLHGANKIISGQIDELMLKDAEYAGEECIHKIALSALQIAEDEIKRLNVILNHTEMKYDEKAMLKITPVVYAIHGEKESPLFGEDTFHVSAESTGGGIFYKIENISPNLEFAGKNKIFIEEEELLRIAEACELLKKDIDD